MMFFDYAHPGCISIHALLAESDSQSSAKSTPEDSFLSTLSLRRATRYFLLYNNQRQFLSTLSLRRATTWQRGSRITYVISIHALLAESDYLDARQSYHVCDFYPRSPCGERHTNLRRHCGDNNFYPRSPCGERPSMDIASNLKNAFLSTLSLRRATTKSDQGANSHPISIHALLAESDSGYEQYCIRARISIHALLAESDGQ